MDTGLSQTARKNTMNMSDDIIWNFPIDITFKSTNIHGWPRIAITVYGSDFLGRDVVRGYCSCLVPLSSGSHEMQCEMYTPLATSSYNQFMSWLMGNPPEFYDTKFVCQGDGREVTRVISTGKVKVKLNVVTKGECVESSYNNILNYFLRVHSPTEIIIGMESLGYALPDKQ